MDKPILEQVTEIIEQAHDQLMGAIDDCPNVFTNAAAEIIKLLEAEDKTLTLLAADLDVPLWKAMQIADYGKKEYKKLVLAELPKEMECLGDQYIQSYYNGVIIGHNACLTEMRRCLK